MPILRFLLSVLRALFWVCLLFALDRPYLAVLTLLSLLFHEAFHILALSHFCRGARMQTHLTGLKLLPRGVLSYREERAVAAAGPLGGCIGAGICFLLSPLAPEYLCDFAVCHLLTSLSNLLPIEGYDGYRILKATLALHGKGAAERVAGVISFSLSALLTLLSLFLFGILGEGLWPTGAFLFTLIGSIPRSKNTIFEDLREKRRI